MTSFQWSFIFIFPSFLIYGTYSGQHFLWTKYYLFPFFCKMTGFAISAKMSSVGEINKFNSPLGFEMIKIENR